MWGSNQVFEETVMWTSSDGLKDAQPDATGSVSIIPSGNLGCSKRTSNYKLPSGLG